MQIIQGYTLHGISGSQVLTATASRKIGIYMIQFLTTGIFTVNAVQYVCQKEIA